MTAEPGADYASAGFDGRLRPGRAAALVVVDPARAYVDPGCPLYAGVEAAAEQIRALMGAARRGGTPVVVTRVALDATQRNGGVFARKVPALKWFDPESPFAAYIDGCEPIEGDIEVVKQYPSAFAGTSLAPTLVALGVDTVVLAGFSTSGCVRASATDAMQAGLIPFVVSDAVGDRLPGPHEANLFDIQAKIGEVVRTDRALEILA